MRLVVSAMPSDLPKFAPHQGIVSLTGPEYEKNVFVSLESVYKPGRFLL